MIIPIEVTNCIDCPYAIFNKEKIHCEVLNETFWTNEILDNDTGETCEYNKCPYKNNEVYVVTAEDRISLERYVVSVFFTEKEAHNYIDKCEKEKPGVYLNLYCEEAKIKE